MKIVQEISWASHLLCALAHRSGPTMKIVQEISWSSHLLCALAHSSGPTMKIAKEISWASHLLYALAHSSGPTMKIVQEISWASHLLCALAHSFAGYPSSNCVYGRDCFAPFRIDSCLYMKTSDPTPNAKKEKRPEKQKICIDINPLSDRLPQIKCEYSKHVL
ncbi:hypothetical protein CHS0354_019947 [Potamilus streckersoni]|uniref:Uncharacterized protein n=1 Tax=Potamilus streckersoni TaxID=2493646 RepID=A0AAE0S0Y6_9BIVA|nr:hypothetical protein CHS0354_019947 [Potamilus streckersoni]